MVPLCAWQESHGNEGQEQEGSSPAGCWRCSACGRGPGWFPGLSAVTASDSGLGMPSLHLSELQGHPGQVPLAEWVNSKPVLSLSVALQWVSITSRYNPFLL